MNENIIELESANSPRIYTFMDFFCGAGGFSEGFRQQGFKPVRGIDLWQPAINTHNLNFGLNDETKSVLDFEKDEEIEELEDTDIIIGSPPCVSFSMANKAGKADKSLGIRLIEAFLRVVAVKKHKKDTILKAWYMENVPNSKNFVQKTYTFEDLNLSNWAEKNGIEKTKIALNVQDNGEVLNSNHYGSPQKRERFICGEFIQRDSKNNIISEEFIKPIKTHDLNTQIVLGNIRANIPSPLQKKNSKEQIVDPNYPSLKFPISELTDHFYDSGLYEMEWEQAQRAKQNHPFMGTMSFPENENKPSRTVMATRGGSTRESLIFKSEYKRSGDGEYRLPTIREIATLMGFPYVFNFTGTESTKWKQIGNAVCPHMSFALGKALKTKLDKNSVVEHNNIDFSLLIENNQKESKFNNLNTYKKKEFNKPPTRNAGSKFRRHFFKGGNMTVTLMNHSAVDKSINPGEDWLIYVFLGSGKNFQEISIKKDIFKDIEKFINSKLPNDYQNFLKESKELCKNIPSSNLLQRLFEDNNRTSEYLDLETFFKKGSILIQKYRDDYSADNLVSQNILEEKENIPLFQLLSMYLISLYRSKIK
jgi:DNA (cytosine-5)-methyltransferase 1